ncbi:MAG: VOC family protein [Candidatus Symbiobacter sp.]|nr:VOC family protein [Candidatus Symbiobacter sp.]
MFAQTITPMLAFNGNAFEAADFYVGLFPNARILQRMNYQDMSLVSEKMAALTGKPMLVELEIDGQKFTAFNDNGNNIAQGFNLSISFVKSCATQAEIDRIWDGIVAAGGKTMACGWITDHFGVTWQIIPNNLGEMMTSSDRAASHRTFAAMMHMIKLDKAALEAAFAGP